MSEFKADESRIGYETGIYVRGKRGPLFDNIDIGELDRDSLHRFLRGRGGKNLWAENVVMTLLGHEQIKEKP